MNWIPIQTISKVNEVIEKTVNQPEVTVLFFKHSTRCSISQMVKSRIDNFPDDTYHLQAYYIDLLAFREVSDYLASESGVTHESPQAIFYRKGKIIGHLNHTQIKDQAVTAFLIDN